MQHPTRDEVAAFLTRHSGSPPSDLEPLTGGAWSSAWAYRAGDEELVIRFGRERSWYETDRMAMAFGGPELPVPEVREIGTTPDGLAYAISVRHHGQFLEDTPVEHADAVAPTLTRLLVALQQVPAAPDIPVMWHPAGTPARSWRELVLGRLVDDPGSRAHGWRADLAADPKLAALSTAVSDRVGTLIEACPERRDLIHGDLLHGNVLVSPDYRRVQAVISWKCSLRGDFLYDAAWCSAWGPVFYPGIAAIDPLSGLLEDPILRADETALVDAAIRHHCYELQLGLTHLGWSLRTWQPEHVDATVRLLAELLERGPLP
ncbi:Phosphotransferase enzyme family protein [Actinopolymorpha cephalotaxi]|uniref:Aminoglycoside phosphotransferase (APT) family kinase protein n=1 Tax=Actinopolymorpha cephalotaxi TaxID=504797 RepID=A0A1I2N8I7_9ACTN|nr:aminoglycoside phosphotransferase family protein [Actinopolymorpha cephalotaxi]NYH85723.1 aminoglycoside phosphotransferase (APT) family kinase protein [Actinopolymorpha cephalotaxi]SFF97816.1 Phosphotransferase enzyme family protein [Actinopolymorpha cephalotaxi]